MTNIVYGAGGKVLRGTTQAEDFSYSILETPIVSGGTAADASFYDATNSLTTGAGVVNNCQIQVQDSFLLPGHSFVNQAPAVASMDSIGNMALLTPGTAQVDIVTPVGTRRLSRALTGSIASSTVFKAYKAGSLGEHVTNAINALISGKTPGKATQQFASANNFNLTTPAVTRNASLFTSAYDATAISVMRVDISGNNLGSAFPVLLISPRHVIAASHILGGKGKVVWLDSTGVYHTANIISISQDTVNDIGVGYLDTAITGITPFSFLPLNWLNYLGSLNYPVGFSASLMHLPCLSRLQHPDDSDSYLSAMCVYELTSFYSSTGQSTQVRSGSHVSAAYQPWADGTIGVRGGDSGSPIMFPINGKLVLISAHYTAGGGANWAYYSTWIGAQMNGLATAAGDATAYAMLRADLSAFTQYPTI